MFLILQLTLKYTHVFNCQAKNSHHPIIIFNKKNKKVISPLKNKIYKFKLTKDESIKLQINKRWKNKTLIRKINR